MVIVIWGLGLMALLVLGYAYQARLRTQATANIIGAAQAEALAEAGIHVALLDRMGPDTLRSHRFRTDGAPVYCAMPQSAIAAILVENETGKVDINSAPKSRLQNVLAGFGAERDEADRLASAIIAFRSAPTNALDIEAQAYRSDGRAYGPKRALFQTTFELDQVLGMPEALLRSLLPFVTVYSNRPEIDVQTAPPALLVVLAGGRREDVSALLDRPYPNTIDRNALGDQIGATAASNSDVYLFHAEVLMPNRSLFVREAIIDLRVGGGASPAYAIREWRQGTTRYAAVLGELMQSGGGARGPRC